MPTVPVKKINRTKFFSKVRNSLFNGRLTQLQVDGISTILDEWEQCGFEDLRWLSYMLATVLHETAYTFRPINEYGAGKGKKYGIPDPETGNAYFGRGFVQLTWKSNYEKFSKLLNLDLVNRPELANYTTVATDILFEGMIAGMFTGRKLSDYFNSKKTDWVNARRIINGQDKAELIAGYAKKFYSALI